MENSSLCWFMSSFHSIFLSKPFLKSITLRKKEGGGANWRGGVKWKKYGKWKWSVAKLVLWISHWILNALWIRVIYIFESQVQIQSCFLMWLILHFNTKSFFPVVSRRGLQSSISIPRSLNITQIKHQSFSLICVKGKK